MSKYSDFWFDNRKTTLVDDLLSVDDTPVKKSKDHIALAGHKRAIGNFVRIVSGQNIPVKFPSRGDSYTDGKSVTIGASINEKNFDYVVGLALHEGSHIAYSDFNAFAEVRNLSKVRNFQLDHAKMEFFRGIINYIEDRRIDSIVFRSSPGYKGYYHSLYNKYFNGKKVAKGLSSEMYREFDMDSYMFRIVNFTNEATEFDALPRLLDIYKLINMSNIKRLKSTDDAIELAKSVCEIVWGVVDSKKGNGEGDNENSEEGENKESEGGSDVNGDGTEVDSGEGQMTPNGGQPSDSSDDDSKASDGEKLSENQQKQIKNMFEKQKQFLDGKTQKTQLTKKDKQIVDALSNSNTELVEVGDNRIGKVGTVVIPALTKELIESRAFPYFFRSLDADSYEYTSSYGRGKGMIDAINEGFRLGSILGKKLKVRGEEKDLIFTRQNTGKINKRLISELGFGNDNVFSQIQKEKFNKANLHMSIDGSGSMSGIKFEKAIKSAVAMAKAADMAGNIHVTVDIRYTHDEKPVVLVIYNSRKDKLTHIKTYWKALRVAGVTPESLCYEAIMKKFLGGVQGEDNYFINYSDGAPYFGTNDGVWYAADRAIDHTRKMVKMMKNNGMKIMSYFISDGYMSDGDRNTFGKMYGKDASFIDCTNMMNVAKTMNDKFLQK
jgi:hypothetical protein